MSRMLKVGLVGTILTAICCFTPLLVALLSAVGLSALVGYIDLILLPALAIFIAVTLYAIWEQRRA